MSNYKVPPLLPIPLIGVMVASAVLPVLAFVLILQTNQNRLKELKAEHLKLSEKNQELAKQANTRKQVEFQKETYRLLERAFQFRFFRTGAEAQAFWKSTIDVISRDKPYSLSSEQTSMCDKARTAKAPGFEQEYVGQVSVLGNHRALLQFLIDINNLRRSEYFAEAACARVRLPDTIKWEDKKYLQFAAADALSKGTAAESGWYFEPCDADGKALSAKDLEASILAGTRLTHGYIWYQGKDLNDKKVDALKAEAPNDETWGEALDYVFSNMKSFYARAAGGAPKEGERLKEVMPFVRETFSSPPPDSIDPHTGGYVWAYAIPVFFYFEQMTITPRKHASNNIHRLSCRIVFPVRPPLKVDGEESDGPQDGGNAGTGGGNG